jgi:ribonuclease HI
MESQICNFWWGSNVDKKKIHWVNWKKTCKAKSRGGIGFKDLRAFNEALLAKQGWRLTTNPDSLVAKIFKAKYYPNSSFLSAKHTHNSSFSWQSIQKASWVLKKGCKWIIGDGKSIDIWRDRWIHPQFGSTMWTKQPANTILHRVCDLINNQNRCWNAQLIKHNFYPTEADQICSIPITNTDHDDIISWQGTKDGVYSVRSGYQAIMEWQHNSQNQSTSSNYEDNPKWKKLWKLSVPPKQLHLIWRILNNAIPVKEKLHKRGIRCVPLCPHCNTSLETMDHIFLDCDWARKVWFTSPLTINLANSKLNHIHEWIDYMVTHTKEADLQIISTMLYSIWNARNEKEFNGKNIPPIEAMPHAMKALYDYQANQKSRAMQDPKGNENNRNNTSWSLPPKGILKLNVDAHSLSDGRWGLGLLLRRDDGSTVGAVTRTRLGSDCTLLAEAMGLQEALNLIQQWNLSNVIIEMDAKTIVDTVNSSCYPRTNWGMIVDRCVRKMKDRTGIEVKWTRRQGNIAAHELAKWARYEPNKDWVTTYPSCITDQVQKDMVPFSHNQ